MGNIQKDVYQPLDATLSRCTMSCLYVLYSSQQSNAEQQSKRWNRGCASIMMHCGIWFIFPPGDHFVGIFSLVFFWINFSMKPWQLWRKQDGRRIQHWVLFMWFHEYLQHFKPGMYSLTVIVEEMGFLQLYSFFDNRTSFQSVFLCCKITASTTANSLVKC